MPSCTVRFLLNGSPEWLTIQIIHDQPGLRSLGGFLFDEEVRMWYGERCLGQRPRNPVFLFQPVAELLAACSFYNKSPTLVLNDRYR